MTRCYSYAHRLTIYLTRSALAES